MQPTKYVYYAKGRDGKTLIFNGNEKLSDVISILGERIPYRFESFLSGSQIETIPQVSLFTMVYVMAFIGVVLAALIAFNQARNPDRNDDSDVSKKNSVSTTILKK